MPYQMHPSGREKGEFFHFAFKNQILEDGKEIHPSFPFDAFYARLKLIESRTRGGTAIYRPYRYVPL